jgi:hypothetical protein
MVVANPLGVYAQRSIYDIPYIRKSNQQHSSSFQTKRIGFLLLQLFSSNQDVRHMEHYSFLLTPNS